MPWVSSLSIIVRIKLLIRLKLWDVSLSVMEQVGLNAEYGVTRSIVFMMLAEGYSILIHVPFDLYATFVIEESFGFNKQTLLVPTLYLFYFTL